jgi:DNA-3-methyladenine glycosylase I
MVSSVTDPIKRCVWVGTGKPHYEQHHDKEWGVVESQLLWYPALIFVQQGVPVHDDDKHFEMLMLEGAQAGLNWEMIVKRRENYRKAFQQFDPQNAAHMTDSDLEAMMPEDIFSCRLLLRIMRLRSSIPLQPYLHQPQHRLPLL